jgi:hypothetical protein
MAEQEYVEASGSFRWWHSPEVGHWIREGELVAADSPVALARPEKFRTTTRRPSREYVEAIEQVLYRWPWSGMAGPPDTIIAEGQIVSADDPIVAIFPDKFRPVPPSTPSRVW